MKRFQGAGSKEQGGGLGSPRTLVHEMLRLIMWVSKPTRERTQKSSGFTLVEALVATLIMTVGFVGTYTLVGVVQNSMQASVMRQKLQLQANQILDIIEVDVTNVDQYNNMDLKVCAPPPNGTQTVSLLRQYEWCQRLRDQTGAAGANDNRIITVTTLADGSKDVQVLLEGLGGTIQVVMKRVYDL